MFCFYSRNSDDKSLTDSSNKMAADVANADVDSWKTKLKSIIEGADLEALKEAHENDQNLSVVLDEAGNTALSLAISLSQDDIVDFLLDSVGSKIGQEEVIVFLISFTSFTYFDLNF